MVGEKQEFGRYKILSRTAGINYPELSEIYTEHGSAILDKLRLAKNFERYCNMHTVRWGYGKKRLEKEFPEFGKITLGSIQISEDNTVSLVLDTCDFIRFSFTLTLPEDISSAVDIKVFSEMYGWAYIQEYGQWHAGVVGVREVENLAEAYKILKQIDQEERAEAAARAASSPLEEDEFSQWF